MLVGQLCGAAAADTLPAVAQLLAHRDLCFAIACLHQTAAEFTGAVLAAHQHKEPLMLTQRGHHIPLSAVEAQRRHILVGLAQAVAQHHHGAETGHQLHLLPVQQRQQLFGAAEEAHIP